MSKIKEILEAIENGVMSEDDFMEAETAIRSAVIEEVLGKLPEKMTVEQIMAISLESPVDRILCGQYHNQALAQVTQTLEEMKG